ncbi:hypothetical protein LCGC14_2731490 [marine sediment metagenome]|uniref:Uncharacterized protein n=1 Tax=marine sediment metagenome TaxID=412755 RepID=A0A0F9BG19_9ZZZZ
MSLQSHRFTMSLNYDSWQTVINVLRRAGHNLPFIPGGFWAIVKSLEQQFEAEAGSSPGAVDKEV